jgi:hypothetical protein
MINKDNVLKYLGGKYIPTWTKKGCVFLDQKCIQKAFIKEDKTLYIHIKNSEPHKIITDTLHVMNILRTGNSDFIEEIKFYIEQVKLSYFDVPLYNECLKDFGIPIPTSAIRFQRLILKSIPTLEKLAEMKMVNMKRKYLRYFLKIGEIDRENIRKLLAIKDFSSNNIKQICNEVRGDLKLKGLQMSIK